MNNKNLFASILTVTAGLAAPMTYTAPALAKSAVGGEAQLKEMYLKSKIPARYLGADGKIIEGFIHMQIQQHQMPIPGKNLLTSEMIGSLYFAGENVNMGLSGQDSTDVLLDLVHKDKQSRKYEVYGCSTTLGYCEPENIQLSFNSNNTVELDFSFSAHSRVEIMMTGAEGQTYWTRHGHIQMEESK